MNKRHVLLAAATELASRKCSDGLPRFFFIESDGGNDIGVCRGQAHATPNLGTMTGKEAEAFYLGLNAVIWGYPAVEFKMI